MFLGICDTYSYLVIRRDRRGNFERFVQNFLSLVNCDCMGERVVVNSTDGMFFFYAVLVGVGL